MNDLDETPQQGLNYTLSEETHHKLEYIRDQLYMMAAMVLVITQEEEDHPLEMQRGSLGSCFMNFGTLVDEVLDAVTRPYVQGRQGTRTH
ncbi:XAC0095 family protein [Dyella mobilis]|uniref:XAC0095-like domain-containing protein n=1 Tax=Dyella mobilis TaxID=1849582 RepID=A0ABS2KCC9_9GAMM|nr:hypothetical protein [Dyella mobilis]MBM7128427.1 hypothetical protein [Dyella mobilis]GLQ99732.1 hypothetical protein GCM10007863_41520 [Dyella mobilis]